MKCLEHDFKNVRCIEAFVQGTIEFDFPLYISQLYVDESKLTLPSESKKIRFSPGTISVSDKSDESVSGISHVVSVEWETKSLEKESFDLMTNLQNTPHELVFTFFGGSKKIIRTDKIAYSFVYQYDNGVMKCSMGLVNGQGVIGVV